MRHFRRSVAFLVVDRYIVGMSYVFEPGANPGPELDEGPNSEDPWVAVYEGGLEHPIFIRLGWSRDWQIVVTGLVINPFIPSEVTSETLRSIPVGRIVADLVDQYELAGPLAWPENPELLTSRTILHQALALRAPRTLSESRARGGAATDDDLARFANTYKEMRIRHAHRAMTATAEVLHISRATANRWAQRCRKQGLLPPLPPPK